ncbi:UNVERIFIED_CONTAM: putative toxin-antitoxin system antitoxin component (TIGR02293 family) [Acidovorax defluvii]
MTKPTLNEPTTQRKSQTMTLEKRAMTVVVVRKANVEGDLRAKFGTKNVLPTSVVVMEEKDYFVHAFQADLMQVATTVKRGVPADQMVFITNKMGWSQDKSVAALGLSRATFGRKVASKGTLSPEASSRVFGLRRLIGQVEAMVRESGNPEGFDAAAWVGDWLERPQPALGGKTPSSFMDTAEGQQLVMQVLAQAQAGAYA